MHVRKSGSNSNGSGVRIDLGTTVQEIWFSYGTSWAPGYTWSGGNPSYTKDWDWTASCPNCFIMGHQGGGWGANATGGTNYGGSITWSDIYPGGTSDGSWHCYDYHVSLTTGKLEIWVDGEYSRNTTESFSASFVAFGSVIVENQAVSTFDGYTYYDEIRADTGLSTGQRIGCGASASGGGFGRPRMKLKMKGIGGGVLYALGLGLPFTLEDRKW